MYKSEEEFLKNYNPNEFDRLSVTADILVVSVSSEEKNSVSHRSRALSQIKELI